MKIYEDSLGPHHRRVAETLPNLAVMKYEQVSVTALPTISDKFYPLWGQVLPTSSFIPFITYCKL